MFFFPCAPDNQLMVQTVSCWQHLVVPFTGDPSSVPKRRYPLLYRNLPSPHVGMGWGLPNLRKQSKALRPAAYTGPRGKNLEGRAVSDLPPVVTSTMGVMAT